MMRQFRRTVAFAAAFLAAVATTNLQAAPGKVTFTVSGYTGTKTFTNFLVPVRISENSPTGFTYADVAANGADIVFYDANNAEIPYEIDTWNTSGESIIWVRLPSMTAGTTFTMEYGLSSRTTAAADTWTGYGVAFHMDDFVDSADGVVGVAVAPSATFKAGVFGNSRGVTSGSDIKTGPIMQFAVNQKMLDMGNSTAAAWTMSGWFKRNNSYKWTMLLSNKTGDKTGSGFALQYRGGTDGSITDLALWPFTNDPDNGNVKYTGGSTLWDGTWRKLDVVVNNAKATIYIDGNAIGGGEKATYNNIVPRFTTAQPFGVGGHCAKDMRTACADVDEFRIRSGALDGDFVKAQFDAEKNDDFLSAAYAPITSFGLAVTPVYREAATGKWFVPITVKAGTGDVKCVLTDSDSNETELTLATGVSAGEAISYEITGLAADKVYSARIVGISGDEVTEYPAGNIFTGTVSVEAGADADFSAGQNGTFIVSRSVDASACIYDLVVNYTVSGTADAGTDYVALTGTVTIPAGQQSATISVVPYYHSGLDDDLSIVLTIGDGNYAIDGDTGSAEIAYKRPSDAWALSGDNKTMTDGTGWVLNCTVSGDAVTITGVATISDRSTILDLTKKFTVPNLAVTVIGKSAFQNKTTITELYLPNTLLRIESAAFAGCSGITSVTPFLPESVNYLGQQAFYNCSKIETPLFIGMNGACTLQALSNKDYDYTFGGCSKLPEATVGPGVTEIAGKCFYNCTSLTNVTLSTGLLRLCTDAFAGCSNLETIDPFFPETLTYTGYCRTFQGDVKLKSDMHLPAGVTYLGVNNFNGCKAITNVVVDCPSPISGVCTWNGNGETFSGWNNYQARFYVVNNADWVTYANDTTKVTPWGSLDAATQKKYTDMFGTDELPVGATTGFNKQFLVVRPLEGDAKSLVVTGDLGEFGTVSPAYGSHDVTGPMTISADEYVFGGDDRYRVLGHTLQKSVNGAYEAGEFVASRSFTYDPSAPGVQRLVWNLEFAGCRVSLWDYPAECGTVTVTGANPDGFFYGDNTIATLTATANDGEEFLGWGGDVAEADRYKQTITLDLTEPKNVVPVFKRNWTYASNQITDGYWTLNVSGSSGLSVNSIAVNPGIWLLDFAKPVDSGKTITAIGGGFIRNVSTPALREVRFPETLTTIGDYAFYCHSEIRTFEPFLPASVTSVGGEGMSYWTDDGHMAEGQTLTIGMEHQCSLGNQAFSDIEAIAIVIGPKQTSINSGNNAFRRMRRCKTVTYMCGKITHNTSTFANWGAYQARVFVPKDAYLDRAGTIANTWLSDYLYDTAQVTPWASLDAATQKKYTDAYPGEKHPFGLSVSGKGIYCGQQWIMTYYLENPGTMILLR